MALPNDVKIVRIIEDNRVDPVTFQRTPIIRVSWTLGNHGPFTTKFDKATYSAAARDAQLTMEANEYRTT